MQLGALGHHPDNQHKQNEDDQQVPIVEEDLPDHAERHLIGPAQQLDEVNGEVLAEEVERDDVQEIQQDGDGVGHDINEVDELLQPLVVDDA